MKKLVLLFTLLIALSSPVNAGGVYYNNTIYNLDNVIKVTKYNSNTVIIIYKDGRDVIKFNSKYEAKKFFDAVQVVIL